MQQSSDHRDEARRVIVLDSERDIRRAEKGMQLHALGAPGLASLSGLADSFDDRLPDVSDERERCSNQRYTEPFRNPAEGWHNGRRSR